MKAENFSNDNFLCCFVNSEEHTRDSNYNVNKDDYIQLP